MLQCHIINREKAQNSTIFRTHICYCGSVCYRQLGNSTPKKLNKLSSDISLPKMLFKRTHNNICYVKRYNASNVCRNSSQLATHEHLKQKAETLRSTFAKKPQAPLTYWVLKIYTGSLHNKTRLHLQPSSSDFLVENRYTLLKASCYKKECVFKAITALQCFDSSSSPTAVTVRATLAEPCLQKIHSHVIPACNHRSALCLTGVLQNKKGIQKKILN